MKTAKNKNINIINILQELRLNPEWAKLPLFDRSKWQRVKFGDVVANVNDTERDPQGAGIERFIGLEHLEPGSLHIRSWGNVADGTTFNRRCSPGQVLFGKRRAYQRKVAVAEFDAVVSGDIYVFAPKNDRLLPELLPFLCLSDRFFKFAVETSAGSLSPRTNWSSIASFEFDLPSLDQQRKISKFLWAIDESIKSQFDLLQATSIARITAIERVINDEHLKSVDSRKISKTIGELCDIKSGKVNSNVASTNGKYPFFTCAPEVSRCDTYSFDCEALLLAGNNAQGIYTVKHFNGKFQARQRVYVISIRDLRFVSYKYLHLALQRSLGRLRNLSVGSTSKHITIGDLKSVGIPLPCLEEQLQLIELIEQIDKVTVHINRNLGDLSQLRQLMLNQVFSTAQ